MAFDNTSGARICRSLSKRLTRSCFMTTALEFDLMHLSLRTNVFDRYIKAGDLADFAKVDDSVAFEVVRQWP
jgi:hypothetical protein